MPPATVSGRRLLLAAGIFLAVEAVAVTATIVMARATPWLRGHAPDISAVLLLETYIWLLVALMVAFGGPAGLRDRLGFRFTSVGDLALAVGVWLGAVVAGAILTAILVPLLGRPTSNVVPLLKLSHDPFFVGLVVPTVVLLGPAAEELLFRGALFGWLRGRVGAVAAALLSAAVFAGVHLLPPLLPTLFVFGLAAAFLYHRTGSTLNSFCMHVCQNAVGVAAAYVFINQGGA